MRIETWSTDSSFPLLNKARSRRVGLMIGVGVVLIVALAFVWRVVFFYVQLQRGTAVAPRSFLQSITLDQSVAASLTTGNTTRERNANAVMLNVSDDPSLGRADALLTVVEFADFGCPFSREASYVARFLASQSGLVRYIYRDFPIAELHPDAARAAQAGQCANEQNRFLDYHDRLYQNQHNLSNDALKRYAQELGLNADAFNDCLDSGRWTAEVEVDRQDGLAAGVRGTPTFFFNGVAVEGAMPRAFLQEMLAKFARIQEATAPSTR